jgi:predicted permease
VENLGAVVLPIFCVIGLGYGALRFTRFDARAAEALSAYVFNLAIPLLLFRTLAGIELAGPFPWRLLLAYYASAFVVFALGMGIAGGLLGRDRSERAIVGFACTFANSVLLGIPVVLTAFGEKASFPLFLLIAFHAPLLLTAATVVLELSRREGAGSGWIRSGLRAALQSARNPIILGLLAGILCSALGVRIPATLDRTAELVGRSAVPCALFAMGASLAAHRLGGKLGDALLAAALKLVAHPALVWWCATLLGLEPLWTKVAVVLAAMPTGVNVYLFADRYRAGVSAASSAVVLSTGLSIFTISAVLWLLG